jgi:protein TonB
MSSTRPTRGNQSDLLLWVAGGAVAAIGAAWLLILQPWADSVNTAPVPASAPTASAAASPPPVAEVGTPRIAPEAGLDNPLRMAQLAYDAGMLVEPEEYSAWTLYARAAKAEPNNTAATEGLRKVADDLVGRGTTALEQGRFDDARKTVERIRAVMPAHEGAKALAARIWPEVAPRQPEPEILRPSVEAPKVARVEVAPPTPPKRVVDPVVQASEAFDEAMAASRLLSPPEHSAKYFVGVMAAANRDHELTRRARETLSRELLSRAMQSIEALDAEAAGIWIDEAAAIGADAAGVRQARNVLTEHLIATEATKPVPASDLKVISYVAPVYPNRALDRGVQGWVDIEFTVGTDGTTHDVTITDASHETYFRREAVEAVEQWRFEPRVFMNRTIEQRSYTRIRFVQ